MNNYLKYIPNVLTIMRMPLAIASCYFALDYNPVSLFISMLFFMAASSTDYLDGYLARKWKIVTSFGKLIDPIADKVLIIGVLSVFTFKAIIPVVFTALIVFREVLLTIIRLILVSKKRVLASGFSGKLKTLSQVISITAIYLLVIFKEYLNSTLGDRFIDYTIIALMSWVVIITLYSGYKFFTDNKRVISSIM